MPSNRPSNGSRREAFHGSKQNQKQKGPVVDRYVTSTPSVPKSARGRPTTATTSTLIDQEMKNALCYAPDKMIPGSMMKEVCFMLHLPLPSSCSKSTLQALLVGFMKTHEDGVEQVTSALQQLRFEKEGSHRSS